MKRTFSVLSALVMVGGWLVATPAASAALIHFDVFDHPVPMYGFISFLPPGVHTFGFLDGDFVVDTLTGNVTLTGEMIHNLSGEPWQLSATFTGIRSTGTFNGANTVPYAEMFNDLLVAGDSGGALIWGTTPPNGNTAQNTLTLTTSLLNPTYTGPRSFIGKGMGDVPFILSWRDQQEGDPGYFFDPIRFPGALWEALGASGWYSPADQLGINGGDLHLMLRIPPTVIPEPVTGSLFGMGTLLMGWSRSRHRRKGFSKSR